MKIVSSLKRTNYGYVGLLLLAMSACSSDADTEDPTINPEPQGKLYEVSFKLSTFIKNTAPLDTEIPAQNKANGLEGVHVIACHFFDMEGNFFRHVVSRTGHENFGTLKTELPKGTYWVAIQATDRDAYSGSTDILSHLYAPIERNTEVFAKDMEINIQNNPINMDITLERVIG